MEPHTYLLWDPYSLSGWSEALWGDGSARQDGLITEANELGSIGFYFDAAEGKAGSLVRRSVYGDASRRRSCRVKR